MAAIDINVRTVAPQQRAWRLFPGSNYNFLDDFGRQSVAFLDLPGFPLPQGRLSEAKDLIPRIVLSAAVRQRLISDRLDVSGELSTTDFADARNSKNRGRIRQAIINFYEVAQPGDLVVLPSPLSMSTVWIGQFTDSTLYRSTHLKRYGDTQIPSRSIQWIARARESTISTSLSDSLRQQHPFSLLEKSLHIEAFAIAFKSFIFGDRHVATIYNEHDFLDSDSALIGLVSRLSSAAVYAMDRGIPNLGPNDLLGIIFSSAPIEYTCSQESDIHSPGFTRLIAGTIVCLVASTTLATLIYLGFNSSKPTLARDIQALQFVNSSPNSDPTCNARVSEATQRILATLGIDRTWELCQAARSSSERTKLLPSARPK